MVKGQRSKYKANPPIENMKGFMLTCDSGKEKQAIQELKNIVESLCPAPDVSASTSDISKQIEAEVAGLRKQKLLKTVDTGCRGVTFVRLNTEVRDIDPREVVRRLFTSGVRQSRHIARLVPVLGTCNANNPRQVEKLMTDTAAPLLSSFESVRTMQWTVDFKARNNDSVGRQDVVEAVIASVPATCRLDTSSTNVVLVHINRVLPSQKLLCFSLLHDPASMSDLNLHKYYKDHSID